MRFRMCRKGLYALINGSATLQPSRDKPLSYAYNIGTVDRVDRPYLRAAEGLGFEAEALGEVPEFGVDGDALAGCFEKVGFEVG